MPIHFSCKSCARDLFAQEQYEGCRAACPSCGVGIEIPIPLRRTWSESSRDRRVLDMELGPDGGAAPVAVVPFEQSAVEEPAAYVPESEDIDDEATFLKKERVSQAERQTMVARAVAVVATVSTAGWLIYLAIKTLLATDPPYAPVIFCAMLVYGLLSASRQMLNGPATVHVAAASAIMLCMPLTITMGLPVVDLKKLADQTTVEGKPLALEMAQALVLANFSVIGCIFSLPVWFAAVRITLLKRLKRNLQ